MDSITLTYDIVTFIATHVSNVLKLLKLTETNAFNEAKKIKAHQIKAVVVWFNPRITFRSLGLPLIISNT